MSESRRLSHEASGEGHSPPSDMSSSGANVPLTPEVELAGPKGILKVPSANFPEDPNPTREGVVPNESGSKLKEAPTGARWTKLSRKVVNPEALTIGRERFEVRDDIVVVLRVLTKKEIQAYARVTQVLRGTPAVEDTGKAAEDDTINWDELEAPLPEGSTTGSNSKNEADEEADAANKSNETCFSISDEVIESLLDITASLQLRDIKGHFQTPKSSVVLVSPMRRGQSFLDEVVLHMAKELKCSLVSLGEQSVNDLAEELFRQEQTARNDGSLPQADSEREQRDFYSLNALSEYYFASKTQRKVKDGIFNTCMAAYGALFDGIIKKNKSQPDSPGQSNETDNQDGLTESNAMDEKAVGAGLEDSAATAPNLSGEADIIPNAQSPPLLIHYRGIKAIIDGDFGRRFITRMRDAINTLRRKGENITLVVSVTHNDEEDEEIVPDESEAWKVNGCTCWLCECEGPRDCETRSCGMSFPLRKLRLTRLFVATLMPDSVPANWPAPKETESADLVSKNNIRLLKRSLQVHLSQFNMSPPDLLLPSCDWLQFLSKRILNEMESMSIWDRDGVESLAIPLVGRCTRKQKLEAADIQVVFDRVFPGYTVAEFTDCPGMDADEGGGKEQKEAEENENQTESEKDEEQKEITEQQTWEEKLEDVRRECDSKEEELIAHIVDPSTLHTAFEDVILDQEVLDTVKTLVHLSKLKTEAASQALLSQIQIKGAMLYGPPGTGKTHLARAVAKSTGSNMLVLDASTINGKYVGETEKQIHAAFSLAAKLSPCIIFMDEVDSLFYRRNSCDKSWQRAAITQFLQEMDGLSQSKNTPFVLVATNRPGDLDSAFLRRLPQKIPFGLPNVKARAGILRLFLKDDDLDGVDVNELAALTDGYSGSDLKSLCGEAGLMWAMEQQFGLEAKTESGAFDIPDEKKEGIQDSNVENHTIPSTKEAPNDTAKPKTSDISINEQDATNLNITGVSDSSETCSDSPSTSSTCATPAITEGDSIELESHETKLANVSSTSEKKSKKSRKSRTLKLKLTNAHFEKALANIGPSVSQHDLQQLEDFAKKFTPAKKNKVTLVSPQTDTSVVDGSAEAGNSARVTASKENETRNNVATEKPHQEEEENEEDDTPFIEPLPIINPPEDCINKERLPCDYQPLPTPNSIRLVKLDLIQDYDGCPVEKKYGRIYCSTVVVDLADNPEYFALSYTWGNPRTMYTDKGDIFSPEHWAAPAFEIECNGKPVTIATNLYTALISIRSNLSGNELAANLGPQYLPQEPYLAYIWVDALCINQDDLAEKNNQVPLMDRIYSQSQATIMWLGGGEALATTGAIATVGKLNRLKDHLIDEIESEGSEEEDKQALLRRCREFDITRPESFLELGIEPVLPEELVGWYLFVSRSWFKRAWIVQEWVLSPTCVFLCGAVAMKQDLFWNRITQYVETGWLSQIQDIVRFNIVDAETGGVPSWNTTPGIWHRTKRGSMKRWKDVPELFRAPWCKEDVAYDWGGIIATAPAMRVMMGYDRALKVIETYPANMAALTARLSQYPPMVRLQLRQAIKAKMKFSVETFRTTNAYDPRDKIYAFYGLFKDDFGHPIYPTPDYTKTVAQVYTEATQTMAKSLGVRFLAFVGGSEKNEHCLPSWVPDFSQHPGQQFLQDSPIYAAATGLACSDLEYLCDGTLLRLTGCCVDTVAHIQEEPVGAGDLVHGFKMLLQLLGHLPERSVIGAPPETTDHKYYEVDNPHRVTELREQSRFEVLWRTILSDNHTGSGTHPAPEWLGDLHMRRLEGFLITQICRVHLHEVKILLEDVLEEAVGRENRPFYAQCLENLGLKENGLLALTIELLVDMFSEDEPNRDFSREDEVNAILEINTSLAILRGDLPFGSTDCLVPEIWDESSKAMEDAAAARTARNYEKLKDSVDRVFEILVASTRMTQIERNVGGFSDSRELFATSSGRLGVNPGGIEAGDEVWLIGGLHVPTILRNLGDEIYKVMGCAYVHGIMHGEAVPVDRATQVVDLI
ncbi:ATPase family AAA domain-containing protein [Paramyrothecium foliicola]|nr:ATPase family AAA domain-containing protein [Paramyrothecium foliicola]